MVKFSSLKKSHFQSKSAFDAVLKAKEDGKEFAVIGDFLDKQKWVDGRRAGIERVKVKFFFRAAYSINCATYGGNESFESLGYTIVDLKA